MDFNLDRAEDCLPSTSCARGRTKRVTKSVLHRVVLSAMGLVALVVVAISEL